MVEGTGMMMCYIYIWCRYSTNIYVDLWKFKRQHAGPFSLGLMMLASAIQPPTAPKVPKFKCAKDAQAVICPSSNNNPSERRRVLKVIGLLPSRINQTGTNRVALKCTQRLYSNSTSNSNSPP